MRQTRERKRRTWEMWIRMVVAFYICILMKNPIFWLPFTDPCFHIGDLIQKSWKSWWTNMKNECVWFFLCVCVWERDEREREREIGVSMQTRKFCESLRVVFCFTVFSFLPLLLLVSFCLRNAKCWNKSWNHKTDLTG